MYVALAFDIGGLAFDVTFTVDSTSPKQGCCDSRFPTFSPRYTVVSHKVSHCDFYYPVPTTSDVKYEYLTSVRGLKYSKTCMHKCEVCNTRVYR
jgi:hypothetical protein